MGNKYRSQKGPFHQTVLRKDENEEKRHKSRCVYYEKLEEYCTYYCMRCKGSTNCEKYNERPNIKKETMEDDKKTTSYSISTSLEEKTNLVGKRFEEKRRTVDDIRREIIEFSKNNR